MKVFAIIVTYNGMQRDWIQKCLRSINESVIAVQIIVVDNDSSDNTVNYIKEYFPDVILIESQQNLGFGGANNLGLKKGLELGGDYFFLLNQDARVDSNTIGELVRFSKNNPDYGIISPIHLNGKGTALDYIFSNYIIPSKCKELYSDFVLNRIEDRVYESDFICAAAWLITKECLRQVGGFNPSFFHYGEDNNYVHRLHFRNLKIGLYPKVFIYHDRENRAPGKFQNSDETIKRAWTLRLSDPMNKFNTELHIKRLRRKIIAHSLIFNFRIKSQLQKELSLIKKVKHETLSNFNKSISDKEFVFLEDE